MSKQNISAEQKEIFHSSHLMVLITFTICTILLIGESFLMEWEKFILPLIIGAVIICWVLHFRQEATPNFRITIYGVLMMCTAFFYGIHRTSTFDLAIVMAALIVLFAMTGIKRMITLCQFTYYVTMTYNLSAMVYEGESFDGLMITRIALHLVLIFVIGWFAKSIIDKWTQVISNSQEEIEQLTEDTERLNDFLANVSHEIRTPVNAVIGLSSICIDKSQNREILGDLISVRDAGRRVADQISDILDYSELDRKKAVSNNEDYMLSSVLHDLVTELRAMKPRDVEVIIDVDPSIPAVMNTDVSKLKKILRSLIGNGLKYTKKGGVYVRVTCEKHSYGVNLCIEVTDTGIGMSEYELERVFDGFYQADSGRARMGGGLGLGLAIVSGFVSLLGGFMTISSKEDKGTSVHVSLPQKVIDPTSCMSVTNPDELIIGAYLHFEKYPDPQVREYYNSMVLDIVKGLGVQMHRVNNPEDLKLLHDTIHMTHLFIAEEEYGSNIELIEQYAKDMVVVVVANDDFHLAPGSHARVMEKPFYCFPVVSVLNSGVHDKQPAGFRMLCKGVRALVVDDEPMNLVVGKSIFRNYGMEVTTVLSGQESIDICREQTFDIIFMDHMMGGMDGVEAMKRIRADVSGKNGEVPIVALTANAMSSAKQMFLSEGFDGFVSKPIETEELERVMRQVLPKSMVTYEEIGELKKEAQQDFEEMRKDTSDKLTPLSLREKLKPFAVDTDAGLKYCMNDFEFYKSLLLQFTNESVEKIPVIGRYYESSDWKNYEILVHALKSTSKMIGAMDLSESAKALEMASKENREEFITENHYPMMGEYSRVARGIASVLAEESPKEEVKIEEPEEENDEDILEFIPQEEEGGMEE